MSILQDYTQSPNLFSIYQFMAIEMYQKQQISLFEHKLGAKCIANISRPEVYEKFQQNNFKNCERM